MAFKSLLRAKILEVLASWPAADQYAIMFLIYPNEAYEYRGYSNLPEFSMLYRCESDVEANRKMFEERWNPAFWYDGLETPIIRFDEPNPVADALIDWYEASGVQQIGEEDPNAMYDSHGLYIGKGPNGLPELLQVVAELANELQRDGTIEAKFGRRLPIILADLEFTWYMIKATHDANPNGEADEYVRACVQNSLISDAQLE